MISGPVLNSKRIVVHLFPRDAICLGHTNTLLVFIIVSLLFLKKLLLISCDHGPRTDKIARAILCQAIQMMCIVPQMIFVPM